ncbi:hypothetical protein Tco_1163690 [Tanacetum coccineum]
MSKKQDYTAMSIVEAEYVALSASCAQVMWMRTQLKDYGFDYNKIPLYCDSQSAIAISCNPVQHSRTKHINVRYQFIKEHVEHGIIKSYFVRTEYQLADMFTKALSQYSFEYLIKQLGVSNDVLVSIEGVAEWKRNVRINGLKKEAPHTAFGRNQVGLGGNRKRPYETGEPRVTKEIAFLAIPRNSLTDAPIILEGTIECFRVQRIYVDGGSSSEIMYEHCFKIFSAYSKSKLRKSNAPLVGFSVESYHPLGLIDLRVTMGEPGRSKTIILEFAIVKCCSYNVILERTRMRSLRVVGSTIHLMIKFPMINGVATLKTSKEALRKCMQIEEMQNLWKETQWHQYMEQMSRITEQTILLLSPSKRGSHNFRS